MKAPQEIISRLQEYCTKRDDIILAYLFGSQAKGTATPNRSDYDIAIYFKSVSDIFEYEAETGEYPTEADVADELGQITGTEIDLVVLNRAPADILFSAINGTIILAEKDRDLFMRLLLLSSADAEIYRDMVYDFAKIAARSNSLTEQDKITLLKITTFIRSELLETIEAAKINQQIFERDRGKRKILEKSVENLGVAAIDIAKILLASNHRNIPPKYTDTMKHLSHLDDFDLSTSEWFARAVKLRNHVAHEYLDLEFSWLQNFVRDAEKNFNYLIEYAEKVIAAEHEISVKE